MLVEMNWKTFKNDWLFGSPLDLKKLFPNYFDKIILRSGYFFMFLFLLFTAYSNDWNVEANYVDCPETSLNGCWIDFSSGGVQTVEGVKITVGGVIIPPGDCYGDCPNGLARNFSRGVWSVLLGTLLFNHMVFMIRNKKFYPKPDACAVKKIKEAFEDD